MFSTGKPKTSIRLWCFLGAMSWAAIVFAGVNVTTYHNDNARTGQNTNETLLTPLNVNANSFGRLFTQTVDGYVYAQPLVMSGVNIPGRGVHDVVYVVTEHDSVYAFDADSNAGSNAAPLWQVSFLRSGVTNVTAVSTNILGCGDLVPEIGITSTPVIDPATGALYVEAKTQEVAYGVTNFFHHLHALNLTNGAEMLGGPAVIQAAVPGTGDGGTNVSFDPLYQMNRPGLLLNQGVIYLTFASHCDLGTFHGWVLGYDAHTLTLSNAFNVTPNGSEGGIWQAGCGPAADSSGNVYSLTGNGTFDGPTGQDYSDSFLKLSTTNGLAVASYFTPFNQADMAAGDLDLDSGGGVLLSDAAGSAAHPHLMVGAGKPGTVYLVDRDNMGGYNVSDDSEIVQSFPGALGNCFATPAYFNNTLYYIGGGYEPIKAFTVTNASIVTTPAAQGPTPFWWPGATPSVSANGTNDGIIWAIDSGHYQDPGNGQAAILHAFNATNVALELYSSTQVAGGTRDFPGQAVKFTLPTVANGRVYVGAAYSFSVFGLTNFAPTPVITPGGGVFYNSVSVTITDAVPAASIYYTLDGSPPTAKSQLYTGPVNLTNSATVQAMAVTAGAAGSGWAPTSFTVLPNSFLASSFLPNGQFQMLYDGVLGSHYVLFASTNLTVWTPLATNLAITNQFNLLDPGASNFPQRFYRVEQQ